MNILLLSTSARGHAIADALARSPQKPSIISLSPTKNPGMSQLVSEQYIVDVTNADAVLDIAQNTQPDFAIIGPEDPLAGGIVDILEGISIPSVGPHKKHAQIEASKGFTRDLLEKYGIDASPAYKVFTEPDRNLLNTFIIQELGGDYVVKYDALKGGKGVKVSGEHLESTEEGVQYAIDCIEECGRVVVEEKLIGVEFSLISFVSGTQVVDTPAIQDHKRAYNGDTGPNTGGMGTYSDADHSLPFLQNSDIARAKEINRITAELLEKDLGSPYKGFLYGGFIATKNGVKLIEYNARLGDPEALNILPLLSSDFVAVCQGIISGELNDSMVTFEQKATVCKYITPDCYPESKDRKGEEVVFPDMPENARIFYGDIDDDNGTLRLGGSRTAGIVGIGDTITEAENIAQELCMQVQGPVRFRDDIGTAALIQQRRNTMNTLRGTGE